MNCTICHQPIVLSPSAAERARKDMDPSHDARYYTSLFTEHTKCFLEKRAKDTHDLMKRLAAIPPTYVRIPI